MFDKQRLPAIDWRALATWPKAALVLGCVGRYHPDKGQDLLIEAISTLRETFPNLRCVMVGRGCDSDNHDLRKLLCDYGLERVVHLAGERRDIPACLAGFNYFCMPSRTEGFPNGLAEAMAAGVPSLATDVGDASELAAGVALIVEPGSSFSIAEGLRKLLASENAAHEARSKSGRARIEEHFSINAVRRRYYSLYKLLMDT